MPRVARKKGESGYYHIVLRGINKQVIFYDEEDRLVFLNRLKLINQKDDFEIVAFCLMTNHVHLLLKENLKPIGESVRKVLSSYVYWYNRKYERIGYLFQDRFKSEPIEDDAYLLCCARYIYQNPIKANACENIWEYKWSSANLLLNQKKSFVSDGLIKDILKAQLKEFMEETENNTFLEWESKTTLTDEKMKEKVEKVLKNQDISDISQTDKEKRNRLLLEILQIEGMGLRQAARITGVSVAKLRYLK